MADLIHNLRYGDRSKVVDDAFGEIAMSMDITSTIRLAACSKELYRQVTIAKGCRCRCGTLVAYQDILTHTITCPHGMCKCIKPGYEFGTPPAELVAHLREAHSMDVRSFHYGEEHMYIS